MRAVIQRVTEASVDINEDGKSYSCGHIGKGLVVFLGVEKGDSEKDAVYMAEKICGLRIFEDENEKMNLSVTDVKGGILAISQFTLLGDARKGRRPGFTEAEEPVRANELYVKFIDNVNNAGITVEKGKFRADMLVKIFNDGPVTILLDSNRKF